MDKLHALEEFTHKIYLYMACFWLGVFVATLIAERYVEEHPPAIVAIPTPCKECQEKKKQKEEVHRG